MTRILKYIGTGELDQPVEFSLPQGGRIVHAEFDLLTLVPSQRITLWWETSQEATHDLWRAQIVGTGQPYPADGAFQIVTKLDGPFVWHLVVWVVKA